MAFTPFNPTGAGGTNIPFSNGSNQVFGKLEYENLFHRAFLKPEWDNIIHKRVDESPFAYIMDKVLQEEAPLIGEKFEWSEMGHTQRYNTVVNADVSGTIADVEIPSSETQLMGIGSVVMSQSGRQYKVTGYDDGDKEYSMETIDGQPALESDWGTIVSEDFTGGQFWHLYDNADPCGALVKGSVPLPDKYEAWATIIQTKFDYCYDELTQPVWVGQKGLFYFELQEHKISEHQMQKEKYVMFSQGIGTSGVGSTPGIIPQLFSFGTSYFTVGAITDKVMVDYDAMLKTNGGGRGEYLVLCSHIKMAEVTQAMKEYRIESYAGLFKDVKDGKFSIEFESIKINGTIYHFMAYDFFSYAPTNATATIDYNNLLVFLNVGENGGKTRNLSIKYVAIPMNGRKENTILSLKTGHPASVLTGGQRSEDSRCFSEGYSSKLALIFRKKTKSGLLISTEA